MTKDKESETVAKVPSDLMVRVRDRMAKFVLMALWTNPSLTAVGITQNAVGNISRYTGLEPVEVEVIFESLIKDNQIEYDESTSEVLVAEWLDMNYLQDNTYAEHPSLVLEALNSVQSPKLKGLIQTEISRLDVLYDAGITQ